MYYSPLRQWVSSIKINKDNKFLFCCYSYKFKYEKILVKHFSEASRITNINYKTLSTLIAIFVAILTTGYLRIHWVSFLPETDGGIYSFYSQYFYTVLSNGENIDPISPVILYSLITSWVYGLEINQFIALRWIDLCLAVIASIVFFKVIEKESGSILFSVVTVAALLLVMHDYSLINYGFRNSIWAAYLPLFLALLISQNINSGNKNLFYLIGVLATFGVLLREPFLPFYIVGGVAILITYGWKMLVKYLIGSFVFGLTTLFILIMLRGGGSPWMIFDSYIGIIERQSDLSSSLTIPYYFSTFSLIMIKGYWFGIVLSAISTIYLLKLHFLDKKLVAISRFYFWLALSLVPILEATYKIGFDYHFANCIPGLAGMSAMGWRYVTLNEPKMIKKYLMVAITVLCISGVYGNTVKTLDINVYHKENSIRDAYHQLWKNNYSEIETIRKSNFLIAADMLKQLSNKDSTLAIAGFAQVLFPLTGLLPTSLKMYDLRSAYLQLDWNEDEFVSLLKKERPTIIFPTKQVLPGIPNLTRAIQRTGLYERVAIISYSPNVYYKTIVGDIYRLKSFKQ